jgi:hypothetical protein
VKIMLGVAGLAVCALLGAGGALLVKHFLTSGSHADPTAARVAPAIPAQAAPAPPAPSAALAVVPALPAQAVASTPDVSDASPATLAPASAAATPEHDVAAIEMSPRAGPVSRHAATSRVAGKPPRGGEPDGSTASARADKARCLANVNAITADLSLRNEPPTPEQLAILKRGCK